MKFKPLARMNARPYLIIDRNYDDTDAVAYAESNDLRSVVFYGHER